MDDPTQAEMRGCRDADVIQDRFTIEDLAGEIRGCCVLRGAKMESEFAEVVVALDSDAAYDTPSRTSDRVYREALRR